MVAASRPYDIVLWGATGFTGRLVAEHLADRYADEIEWAIAGRDRAALATLRETLGPPAFDDQAPDVLTGDAFDRDSLDAIAGQTAVVCSTVGPYAQYGDQLVAACVDQGTHYCDLAGEVHWMQRMVDAHHELARDRGVRIVHGCGFDSVPSDLGTLFVQDHAQTTFGTPCDRIQAFVSSPAFDLSGMADATSGGTLASMRGTYEAQATDPQARRALANPYSLAPAGERTGPDDGSQVRPRHDPVTDQWTAPFVMAAINQKIVHRTNAVLEYPWGRAFRYGESTPTGEGLRGAAIATGKTLGLGAVAGTVSVGPLRRLADRYVLPEPGEGPTRETIETGSFTVRLVGTGTTPEAGEPFTVDATVTGDRDPGYGSAARMVGEAAMCLAAGETDTPLDGGVLTPASGIGLPLVDRLETAGMSFTVRSQSAR